MPHIDHRVALVLLSAIIVAAGVPLAVGWARLIPADREPFAPSSATTEQGSAASRDSIAIVLLGAITISYAARFPGVPIESLRSWLDGRLPVPWPEYIFLGIVFLLVFAPAFAACYALLRTNLLRVPLFWAGVLILLVWFATPYLFTALMAPS